MAGVAIIMAPALVMPWGMRLPGGQLVFCAADLYGGVAGPAGDTAAIRLDVAPALHLAGVLAGAAMGRARVRTHAAPEPDRWLGTDRATHAGGTHR